MKNPKHKVLFLFAFCILQSAFCNAQNLVPNPSFEEYDTCPNSVGQIYYAKHWFQGGPGNPDYFNSCASTEPYPGNQLSVPKNAWGYQFAYDGNAYCGLYSYDVGGVDPNYREYIDAHLLTPLTPGNKYYVIMEISLPDKMIGASNKMGFLFTLTPYYFDYSLPNDTFRNFSQIYTDSIISDTVNWVTVSGSFVADSAYNYISIGNFFADSLTSYYALDTIQSNKAAYYYIDMVCVSLDSSTCFKQDNIYENILNDEIEISPNPVNSVLHIYAEKIRDYNFKVYNITGELILQSCKLSNNTEIDLSQYPKGIYFLQIITVNKILNKKFIIN